MFAQTVMLLANLAQRNLDPFGHIDLYPFGY
jgi:hypothetical protein